MGRLAWWDAKVLGLNSTDRLGWAGLDSGTQPHYEDPDNLHIGDVIVAQSWPWVSC